MANPPGLALDAECTRTVACRRFGPLVKCLRLGRGMTQDDLEAACGVKRRTVGDTEQRKTHATIESGKRMSHGLRLKLWMLLIVIEDDEDAGPDTLPGRPITREEFLRRVRRRLREEWEAVERAFQGLSWGWLEYLSRSGAEARGTQPRFSASVPESPRPQPRFSASGPESPHPQPRFSASVPESPHPQPRFSASVPESPHPQPRFSASVPESPRPQPRFSAGTGKAAGWSASLRARFLRLQAGLAIPPKRARSGAFHRSTNHCGCT